jgi:hypothetical protein
LEKKSQSLIGIPLPPIHITMELLHVMQNALEIMLEKVMNANDLLGDRFYNPVGTGGHHGQKDK